MTKATRTVLTFLNSGGFVCMGYTGRPAVYNNTSDFIRFSNRPFIEKLISTGCIKMQSKIDYHYITPIGKSALNAK